VGLRFEHLGATQPSVGVGETKLPDRQSLEVMLPLARFDQRHPPVRVEDRHRKAGEASARTDVGDRVRGARHRRIERDGIEDQPACDVLWLPVTAQVDP
jgi:hypothetical protein